jgi:CRP-like cAMP-binding protein
MDIKFIKQIPFFSALSDEKAEIVLKAFRMKSFGPGDIIFNQDDLGDGMYGIIFGEVEVIRNGEQIAKLGNNAFFGEMALIAPEPRSATIKAVSDLSVFFLSKSAFDEIKLDLGEDVKAEILSRIQEAYS